MENGGDGHRNRHYGAEDRAESLNLRDFLRIKEEDNNSQNRRTNSLAGLTLGAVLSDKGRVMPERTLFDIIREDQTTGRESKRSWKAFRDKLRLRRAGSAWTSSVPIPTSDVPIPQHHNNNNNRMMMMRRNSTRFPATNVPENESDDSVRPTMNSLPSNRAMLLRRNTSRIPERQASRLIIAEPAEEEHDEPLSPEEEERDGDEEEEEEVEGETEDQPAVRMSLMALLAETDRQMGLDGSGYLHEEEDEEEEEEESAGAGAGGEYNNCCVCMVRHKGAAFIPCGHTFCRLCSRELWVQRGNCPLCNNFILEILDIF